MLEFRETLQNIIKAFPEYFQMIGFMDVIDIVIVAFGIFMLLKFCQNSRLGQVMRALLLLVAFMVLANILQLRVTRTILNGAMGIGFLAVIVIFQKEIRLMLEKMGSVRFTDLIIASDEEDDTIQAIDEMVKAYTAFSREKVGALMVFERDTVLDDIIDSGTRLDCRIDEELLKNLFWNKAPLHDGAIIVRKGRIIAAGCTLPLTGMALDKELGMRHRAAIGCSESNDSVVAVCSEETGTLSVAVGGTITRRLTPEELKAKLTLELVREENKGSEKEPKRAAKAKPFGIGSARKNA